MEQRRGLDFGTGFYLTNSETRSVLEDERTKVWRLGYPLPYDLLNEELTTGKITYPEEQL
jgi:hypothetical protein